MWIILPKKNHIACLNWFVKLNNGPLVNRFWNRKSHSDAFHKPTLFPPNNRSNLIFDVTFYIKINYSTYWRTPPKPPPILISFTNDGSTLNLIYLQRTVPNRKQWTNQHCLIQVELGDLNKINCMKFHTKLQRFAEQFSGNSSLSSYTSLFFFSFWMFALLYLEDRIS